jgi:hypothetical protein
MGNVRPETRIKGLSAEQTDRLKRFTKSLNAELVLLGGESIDVLEAHEETGGTGRGKRIAPSQSGSVPRSEH